MQRTWIYDMNLDGTPQMQTLNTVSPTDLDITRITIPASFTSIDLSDLEVLTTPTAEIETVHEHTPAPARHRARYSLVPVLNVRTWLRKPRHRVVADVDTQTMVAFTHARCHCGTWVMASGNPRNRNAAQWRFCGTCINRRFCKKYDRCG